jgi:hypothetical protein
MLSVAQDKALDYAVSGREAERERLSKRNAFSEEKVHYEMMAGVARFMCMMLKAAVDVTPEEWVRSPGRTQEDKE